MTDDKKVIAKGLHDLADQIELSSWVVLDSFNVKADVQRDFIQEEIKDDGYKHFAPTGMRTVSIKLSYQLDIKPQQMEMNIEEPIGSDWE